MGSYNRARVEQEFDWSRSLDRMESVYAQVLRRDAPPSAAKLPDTRWTPKSSDAGLEVMKSRLFRPGSSQRVAIDQVGDRADQRFGLHRLGEMRLESGGDRVGAILHA